MISNDNETAVTLSGRTLSTSGAPINQLYVMAVNAIDIRRQYRAVTDQDGRFAIELPTGIYDLIFFEQSHALQILCGVTIEKDLQKQVVMSLAAESSPGIRGCINQPDGTPAAAFALELRDSSGAKTLASATTGEDGKFAFGECAYGYYVLSVRSPSGDEQILPLPKPQQPVELNITLTDERPLDQLIVAGQATPAAESATTTPVSQPFTVCQSSLNRYKYFRGGLLAPQSTPLGANVLPFVVNVYVTSSIWGYFACADCRTPSGPFGQESAPSGQYWFTDEAGTTYWLIAILPYVHSVWYLSSQPTIKSIEFHPSTTGAYDAWMGAPDC